MKVGSLVEVINDTRFYLDALADGVSLYPKKGDICIVDEITKSSRLVSHIAVGLSEYPECYVRIDFLRELQPPMSMEFINEMQLELANHKLTA